MSSTPEAIAERIRNWDAADVGDLLAMITDLKSCRDDLGYPIDPQGFVDMSDLPSAPIPDDIDTSYPVWAVDIAGRALVGEAADKIMSINEIREAKNK